MNKLYNSLYNCVAKKGCRYPSLEGLLHDKGKLIASDTWVIAMVSQEYAPELEGKIIDRKGKTIEEKPLNYLGVIPADDSIQLTSCQYDVVDLLTACLNMPQSPDVDNDRILIDFDGLLFYPPRLIQVLHVFEQLGEHPLTYVRESVGQYGCMLLKSNSCTAVVMAVKPFGGVSPETYTVQEAFEIGDLL